MADSYKQHSGILQNLAIKIEVETLNLREWTMREWTYRHDVARVDNARVEISAPCGRGGQCRSGQSEHARTQLALLAETDFLAGVDSLL